jgi:hypothetical protein
LRTIATSLTTGASEATAFRTSALAGPAEAARTTAHVSGHFLKILTGQFVLLESVKRRAQKGRSLIARELAVVVLIVRLKNARRELCGIRSESTGAAGTAWPTWSARTSGTAKAAERAAAGELGTHIGGANFPFLGDRLQSLTRVLDLLLVDDAIVVRIESLPEGLGLNHSIGHFTRLEGTRPSLAAFTAGAALAVAAFTITSLTAGPVAITGRLSDRIDHECRRNRGCQNYAELLHHASPQPVVDYSRAAREPRS